jgi:hypothetical protein
MEKLLLHDYQIYSLPIVVAAGKNKNCPVDGSRTNWKPTGGGIVGISIGIAEMIKENFKIFVHPLKLSWKYWKI